MAIENRTRIWNGLRVYESIDTTTGQIQLYGSTADRTAGTGVLATSPPNAQVGTPDQGRNWEITDATTFTRLYNNRRGAGRGQQLSTSAFTNQFFNNGRNLFNTDRATVLNDQSADLRTYFSNTLGIPGVIHPTSRNIVNASGNSSSNPIFGSTQSTLTDGSTPIATNINAAPTAGRLANYTGIRRYPEQNLSDYGYDYIQLQAYEYVGSLQGAGGSGSTNRFQGQPKTTIQLPMQPNLSETNATGWNEDTANLIQLAAGAAAQKTMNDLATKEGAMAGATAALAGGGGAVMAGVAGKAIFETTKNLSGVVSDPATIPGVAGYFAGQAVGANILGRSTGQVINPNLELLFNGPKLRTFSFNFPLTPRTDNEAETIRRMIKDFKQYMAPKQTTGNLFLDPPCLWKLEYIYNGGSAHPWMNKFKPCALTSFGVDYTPDGSYMTYDDGSMTAYRIALAFSEIEPIYSNEYQNNTFQ